MKNFHSGTNLGITISFSYLIAYSCKQKMLHLLQYEHSYGIGISVCDRCSVIWEQRPAQPSVPINLRSVGNGQEGKYVSPIFSEKNNKIYLFWGLFNFFLWRIKKRNRDTLSPVKLIGPEKPVWLTRVTIRPVHIKALIGYEKHNHAKRSISIYKQC